MNDQMKFIKHDLKYLEQMIKITSLYLFQSYIGIFLTLTLSTLIIIYFSTLTLSTLIIIL